MQQIDSYGCAASLRRSTNLCIATLRCRAGLPGGCAIRTLGPHANVPSCAPPPLTASTEVPYDDEDQFVAVLKKAGLTGDDA